jgi:hypothetical protein
VLAVPAVGEQKLAVFPGIDNAGETHCLDHSQRLALTFHASLPVRIPVDSLPGDTLRHGNRGSGTGPEASEQSKRPPLWRPIAVGEAGRFSSGFLHQVVDENLPAFLEVSLPRHHLA